MPQPDRPPQPVPEPQPERQPARGLEKPSTRLLDRSDPAPRRRTILGGLIAATGIASLGYLLKVRSRLPEPAGQIVGPEYRARTLAAQPAPQKAPTSANVSWTSCLEDGVARATTDLDLVLVIDTTGSMGPVLSDVKANVASLISGLQGQAGTVRVGVVAYRDYADAYVVRPFPLTYIKEPGGLAALNGFIGGLRADGGGDWPEAMSQALDAVAAMNWRGDVPASVIVIADAPPHPEETADAISIARNFRSKIQGSRISLVDTGSGGNPIMREIPAAGGGRYVTYDGQILNSLYAAFSGCAEK